MTTKILEVQTSNALKAFKETDAKGKQLLSNLFGEKVFNQKITDQVKTFDDAFEIAGNDAIGKSTLLGYVGRDRDMIAAVALMKLIIIARALNEGWEPDWNNSSEYKYYPWFKMKAGFGFSNTDYVCTYSDTGVGSRLCFKTQELAEYAGKQFEAIYNDFLTL